MYCKADGAIGHCTAIDVVRFKARSSTVKEELGGLRAAEPWRLYSLWQNTALSEICLYLDIGVYVDVESPKAQGEMGEWKACIENWVTSWLCSLLSVPARLLYVG